MHMNRNEYLYIKVANEPWMEFGDDAMISQSVIFHDGKSGLVNRLRMEGDLH